MRDFAFFAVNFGYSKRDYLELTYAEKSFLMKAYEDKVVADSNLMAAAVGNAVGNALRKKGKRPRKLWRKAAKPGDYAQRQQQTAIAKKIEEKEGKRWVDLVYAANGRRRKH